MSAEPPPSARRRRPSWLSPVWLVPLIAAGGLAYFIRRELAREGPSIELSFIDGEGLQARRTDLKYRGVKVGEVSRVDLSDDLARVVARVQLERSAKDIARQGSLFWIVRPEVSAGGIRGLGTVVSGAYIETVPGRGPPRDRFEGLEEPPAVQGRLRRLEIYVLSDRQASLQPGASVSYRGIKVGAVADTSLSNDAASVRTRVVIERPYQKLVRAGSRFWNAGGVRFHLGFGGLEAGAESAAAIVQGGIAFATPDPPGALAKEGSEFALAAKPKDEWLKWRPRIALPAQPPQSER